MQDTIAAVRRFLNENFLMDDALEVRDDTSFMEEHILDSTGFIELITWIEEAFHVRVHDEEMLPENFDTLANIARWLERKRMEAAA
ncbi:MAG TPA: acyl carrier protein [Usitatibacter sp.]|nr:acyl carrier protein [Usitatibacter sp.]